MRLHNYFPGSRADSVLFAPPKLLTFTRRLALTTVQIFGETGFRRSETLAIHKIAALAASKRDY